MRIKVSVIGHFAEGLNLLNGQTVKTKIITEELQNRLGQDQVLKIDTHGGWKTFLKAPFQVLQALRKSANVLIFPAHNGLRVYAPLLYLFRGLFRDRRVHYIVIGGWLPEFLKKRPLLSRIIKSFDGVYVETTTMQKVLDSQGFRNITVMPNCKNLKILSESELIYAVGEPYKLCTFSRVMKEKGIEDAIQAVRAVNESFGRIVYTLDIYGQVDSAQMEWFESLKADFPEYIRYGGVVPFDRSVDVLKTYYALLFPTYYEGEGFAGTILDAFAAGVPVIASDWKYNREIVEHMKIGIVYSSELMDLLIWCQQNASLWNSMKSNCLKESRRYLPKTVIQALIKNL